MLKAGDTWLRGRGIEAPRLSMECMMGRVLAMSRLDVYLAHDRPLTEEEKSRLRGMVARRGEGEPLAYILGDQEFCDLVFEVNEAVLIPRPETERIVEILHGAVPEGARGVDLGTGSGAIAVALCHARPDVSMVATDVSAAAIEVAARNAATHGVADRIEFRVGSWWEAVGEEASFDFVASNPPYVDPARPELLAADVRAFEPGGALFTPSGDPGEPYRQIVHGAVPALRSGGLLVCETGVGADAAARSALEGADGLCEIEMQMDEAELPRYLLARRSQTPRATS